MCKFMLLAYFIACTSCQSSEIATSNQHKGLSLTISEPKLIDQQTVLVNLNITNESAKSIHLFERWNSWGAYQWSFVVVIGGQSYLMNNKETTWTVNYPSTFTIEPGATRTVKCVLVTGPYNDHQFKHVKEYDYQKGWAFTSSASNLNNHKNVSKFELPCLITAILAPAYDDEQPSNLKNPPN